jgi:hypothetical protein
MNVTSFLHRSSCIGTLPCVGAITLYKWGRWGFLSECAKTWGGEEVGRGMVERFHLVARPYEIKTQNKEV